MSKHRRNKSTQLCGEHAVASELARQGWLPAVMSEAWPGFDIMALGPEDEHLRVQVKTKRARGPMIFAPHGPRVSYPVVFVRLWDEVPEFFPVPRADVERLRDENNRAYIKTHPNSSTDPEVRMKTAMVTWDALEPFRDRWDLILDERSGDED